MPKKKDPFLLSDYRPSQVANFFIVQSFREEEVYLSPLKLLKLVYFSYGWWLAVTEQRLFDEPIEAWQNGPVVPSLYHEFKRYGGGQVLRCSKEIELSDEIDKDGDVIDQLGGRCINIQFKALDEEVVLALRWTWKRYRPYSAVALSQITHQSDTPWARAKERRGGLGGLLSDHDVHEHFCHMKQVQEAKEKNKMAASATTEFFQRSKNVSEMPQNQPIKESPAERCRVSRLRELRMFDDLTDLWNRLADPKDVSEEAQKELWAALDYINIVEKTKAMVHLIFLYYEKCQGQRLDYEKLCKILWALDLHSFLTREHTISGAENYRMESFGPAPEGLDRDKVMAYRRITSDQAMENLPKSFALEKEEIEQIRVACQEIDALLVTKEKWEEVAGADIYKLYEEGALVPFARYLLADSGEIKQEHMDWATELKEHGEDLEQGSRELLMKKLGVEE